MVEAAVLSVDDDDVLDARQIAVRARRAARDRQGNRSKNEGARRRAVVVHRFSPRLARDLRSYGQPAHAAALAMVVVDRRVLRAAVIPDRECARLPAYATGELRLGLVGLQEFDQRPALRLGHASEPDGMRAGQVKRLAPGIRVRAHDRMLGFVLLRLLGVVHFHPRDLAVHPGAAAAVLQRRAVHAHQPSEHRAHALGERFVRGVHVREQRVTAIRRSLERIEHCRCGRLGKISSVRVPAAAEVGRLALFLHHLEDMREALDAGDERIGAWLAEAAADLHQVRRLELLAANRQHLVVEERAMQRAPAGVVQRAERHPVHLGTKRSRERRDVHAAQCNENGVGLTFPPMMRAMTKRIAVVGAGALGGYVGGNLAQLGHDVTLIDAWPEHVETVRARGLELDGVTPAERFTVKNAKTFHLTEVQSLVRTPVDIAFVSVKSYDTAWATALIAPYLSPNGFIVSLQNCLNEETIAGIVGWGRVVGVIASLISVDMYEAARIRRTVAKGGDKYTIFRIGEPHGRITPRVEELVGWFKGIDSAKATPNLWGERWTKLVQNGMGNGVTAATGLTTPDCARNPAILKFQIKLAAEGIRVGRALGYQLEKVRGIEPDVLVRADDGDKAANDQVESVMIPKGPGNPRDSIQRPSMAQDILKGRRTEIEQMNGFIARKGAETGVPAPSHAKLTELVTKIERGELKPSPSHLGGNA